MADPMKIRASIVGDSTEVKAVAIAMPALGPSFGMAPAGTWMWNERSSKTSSSRPNSLA